MSISIEKRIEVPTGKIFIGQGDKGLLEFLSIGDYGKEKNMKADFMGLTKEINGVPHGELLPLSEKWVVTISSQYGCSIGCDFCDVPKVGRGRNASFMDLVGQVLTAIKDNREIKMTKRLNLHYARMGEPTFNPNVLDSAIFLYGYFQRLRWGFHPVVSTMCPEFNTKTWDFIKRWMYIKNKLMFGNAGLQLSINTTDERARRLMFNNNAYTLERIAHEMNFILGRSGLKGRKIALNFALSDYDIDAGKLLNLFNPEHFLCKLTPMHMTKSCKDHNYETVD